MGSIRKFLGAPRLRLVLFGAGIFIAAIGVRLLYWQDNYAQISAGEPWMSGVAKGYTQQAQRILDGDGILFQADEIKSGDARALVHPPGYSLVIAGIFSIWPDSKDAVRLLQIVCDGLSAVIVFLIVLELLDLATAMITGLLIALSPHLAFYSLWLSADTLSVLPIVLALYFIVRVIKRPALMTVIAAGAMIGISCWIRANSLLLAPFLAVVLAVSLHRGKRLGYGLALAGATAVVILPITIRNQIAFHRFVPLSIAGGENLVVGIADFDKEGRFGMPASDYDAALKDAEWHNRPDYAKSPWVPDGIDRDQYRYTRGLEVIRAHPIWFGSVMIRRAAFMLTYNDSRRADWPFDTSKAPIVSAEPGVIHSTAGTLDSQPVWSSRSAELGAEGRALSQRAEVSFDPVSQTLRVVGDETEFGDQFASGPIAVKPQTDYAFSLGMKPEHGPVAVKVASRDLRITLASAVVDGEADSAAREQISTLQMPFASGDRREVRLVVSNNGSVPSLHASRIGRADIFELGPTPHRWTRYPRVLVRAIQKTFFKTTVMLPLVIGGVLLLCLARRGRALGVLLAVPAYYLCFQSALSTEYRYILAIHYFLFVMSAFALYSTAVVTRHFTRWLRAQASPGGLLTTTEPARVGAPDLAPKRVPLRSESYSWEPPPSSGGND